ncbi:hypothetical protein D9758_003448 [Tetrapyrgos nigripes]|uniref:Uncharacterized protein n=1 Tax=Tetrapyrgos nigripes TaxID=182062 RepID=A0A8H5LWB6_9AGAR|nr:hypothetical protein D9758_003448 [Tetrapyrgos nigripes]
MVNTRSILTTFVVVGSVLASEITLQTRQSDPCANIGGQKWVDPADLRACFTSVPVDPAIKENIIDVINKTLPFHASVNYQISAPEPFTDAVHEDLLKDLARISSQSYDSDYDLHLDISKTFKNLKDALFSNFLPIPLVLLTDASGTQAVHIAPEAYNVSSVEFADQIDVWEAALPKGITLKSLNGATVLSINDADPFAAVDANAEITGTFQALGLVRIREH